MPNKTDKQPAQRSRAPARWLLATGLTASLLALPAQGADLKQLAEQLVNLTVKEKGCLKKPGQPGCKQIIKRLEKRARTGRTGRNPQTGKEIKIPAKN